MGLLLLLGLTVAERFVATWLGLAGGSVVDGLKVCGLLGLVALVVVWLPGYFLANAALLEGRHADGAVGGLDAGQEHVVESG